MKIHLFRTNNFPIEEFEAVVSLLQSYPGVIKFIPSNLVGKIHSDLLWEEKWEKQVFNKLGPPPMESIAERFTVRKKVFPTKVTLAPWVEFFKVCNLLRQEADIGDDEMVFLLSGTRNESNWFSGLDPHAANVFIHTQDWDYFIGGDNRFPIAYQIGAALLRRQMFTSYANLEEKVHTIPRGCMNDYCGDKKEVHLKLRTADICGDCQKRIKEKGVDGLLFQHVTSIFEGIRTQMLFKERFDYQLKPSRLAIRGPMMNVHLVDMGNQKIPFNPKEKAIYLLYLQNEQGLTSAEFIDQESQLRKIYHAVTTRAELAAIENVIKNLVNVHSNELSVTSSRIKSKIKRIVGEQMMSHYIIDGARGAKKQIELERSLVEWEEEF